MAIAVRQLEQLIAPAVEAVGCRVWGVEFEPLGRRSVLRIFIDREEGITVDDCERVSRQVSDLLDVEDAIAGRYTLEVSSPGIDRVLFTPDQYAESVGEKVDVRLKFPRDGRRRFVGALASINEDGIELTAEGEEEHWAIQWDEIAKTRIVPNYDEL